MLDFLNDPLLICKSKLHHLCTRYDHSYTRHNQALAQGLLTWRQLSLGDWMQNRQRTHLPAAAVQPAAEGQCCHLWGSLPACRTLLREMERKGRLHGYSEQHVCGAHCQLVAPCTAVAL